MARSMKKKKGKTKEKRSCTKKAKPPNWLPDGWIMEVGVDENGVEFKSFLSPVSGYKFCSRKEVLNYLTLIKNNGDASELTSTGDNSQMVAAQVKNSQEWLPPRWILEIRVRMSGGRAGQKYKCYYDPFSGSRFYSKADVFRFLESGKCQSATRKPKSNNNRTMDNVLSQIEYSPNGLPPGWTKEILFQKSSSNRTGIRKYPYYTDPANGYVFRSLKDALHYVATDAVSKDATGQRRKDISGLCSLESKSPPLIPETELNSLGATARQHLFKEAAKSNAEMTIEADDSSEKLRLPPADHASSESVEKGTSSKHIKGKAEGNGEKEIEPTTENILEIPNLVKKSKGKLLNVPTRASKRLAGCEPADVAELVSHHPSRVEKAASIYSSPDTEHRQRMKEHNKGKQIEPAAESSSHGHKRNHSLVTWPSRASKRLAGCEPDPIAELAIRRSSCKLISNGGNKEKLDDTVQKTEEQAPIADPKIVSLPSDGNKDQVLLSEHGSEVSIDGHTSPVEQLGTEKQTDNRSPSLLAFPFLDSWGDPCIEFAVKTLMGEIPVFDEIPEFVQKHLSAIPTSKPAASSAVEFDHQSGLLKSPSVQPEELHNQDIHIDGKTKPWPSENGRPSVGEFTNSNIDGEQNNCQSPRMKP